MNITTKELQIKLEKWEGIAKNAKLQYEEAQKKVESIKLVFEDFGLNLDSRESVITDFVPFSTLKSSIIEVLKESGKPMKNSEIYSTICDRGTKYARISFDNQLGKLVKNGGFGIIRVDRGVYQYVDAK